MAILLKMVSLLLLARRLSGVSSLEMFPWSSTISLLLSMMVLSLLAMLMMVYSENSYLMVSRFSAAASSGMLGYDVLSIELNCLHCECENYFIASFHQVSG